MNVPHHTPSRKLQQIKYCTQLERRNMTVQYTASCFVHCHNYDSYLIKSYVIIQIMWCISVRANVNNIMCTCINMSAFHLQGAFVQCWTHALQLFNNSKVKKYILSFLPTWLPLNIRVVNVLCFDIVVQCSWSWQIHNWNHHLLWSLLPSQGDSFYHSWPSFPKQQELWQFGHWQ